VVASLLHLTIGFNAYADDSCPKPPGPPGANYSGQSLAQPNFSHQNLTNANFSNAHLTSPSFIGANLTGANFSGATIDTANSLSPDFSFANLTNACFDGAKIGDSKTPAFFEYATLTCADFSNVRLIDEQNNNIVIFGENLKIDGPSDDPTIGDPTKLTCRTAFRSAPMNCEFIGYWRWLDLGDADIHACLNRLRGIDFSGGKFAGVSFSSPDGTDLTDTKWRAAQLSGANFSNANLDRADFTNARLMAISDSKPYRSGAILGGANLSDVIFAGADLSKASLDYAILTGPKVTLKGATLTGSHWQHANLSGTDLTGLTALGADFTEADLDNTTLKNTDLGYNSYKASGTNTIEASKLAGARLCGATLDATRLTCADLNRAHIFAPPGQPSADCKNATITKTETIPPKYTTNTDGVSNDQLKCSTICPNGTAGPCSTEGQWQSAEPVVKQCCVWKEGDPPCPVGKKLGKACAVDCDCHSQHCSASGDKGKVCASNADLTRALLRDRAQ
jgi:uncharacterized protein YjbI with pentapeptide repeats